MVKDAQQVSLKNTKEQILAAYNEALELVKKKQVPPEQEKQIHDKIKQVKEVEQYSYEAINSSLSDVKAVVLQSLDTFSETIATEYKKFKELQRVIIIEQQHLHDLYAIKEQTGTLAAMMLAHDQERTEFDTDMAEKECEWQDKLTTLEIDYKTRKAELDNQRKREEEEYTYTLTQKRRQDRDKYEAEKQLALQEMAEQERTLALREQTIAASEQELTELRLRVDNFAEEMQAKIEQAENAVTEVLKQEFKFTQALKEEQYKRQLELLQQKIESLTEKIIEQNSVVVEQNNRLQAAQEQTQKIAHKALETAAQRNVIISSNSNTEQPQK